MSFWASKLNGEQPKPAVIPSRDMFGLYNTPGYPQPQQSIPQQEYVPTRRLTQGGQCPGCGSSSYMPHPPGQPNTTVACSECGYHPRFEQSGYGEGSIRTPGAPTPPARQTGDHQTMGGALAQLAQTQVATPGSQVRQAPTQYN